MSQYDFSPITEVPFGERAEVKRPLPEFYAALGEAGVRALIDRHYELLKESEISTLFPVDDPEAFAAARKHAADFFIQFLGGPPYFNQSRGAPRMVGRHAPFRITPHARRIWLETYAVALQDVDASSEAVSSFWDYLDTFSTWMVNTPE